MKINNVRRKPASIAKTRWLAYATAGAATALAGSNSAEATIHYSGPINQWIGRFHNVEFPLDQRGDFFDLKHYQIFSGGYGGTARFGVAGLADAAFAGFYHSCSGKPQAAFVSNLDRGQLISNQRFLARRSGFVWLSWWLSCSDYHGQFDGGQVGYIGSRLCLWRRRRSHQSRAEVE